MTIESAIPNEIARMFRVGDVAFSTEVSDLYEGIDPTRNQPVLLKVCKPRAFPSGSERSTAHKQQQKLANAYHDSMARVVAVSPTATPLWIVRDRFDGETLADRISQGVLSLPDAALIAMRVASALAEIHRLGVIHRDVRPAHILLTTDGDVQLIDAGLGRHFRTLDGRWIVGLPGYTAPESLMGRALGQRSDLYSLGAVLFEMLTGQPPYGTSTPARVMQAQIETDAPPLRITGIASSLPKLVATMLSREPRERPYSAKQLEKQLEPFAKGSSLARSSPRAVAAHTQFDDVSDTLVQEDSRIFGIASVLGVARASGSAVPPLPETLALRMQQSPDAAQQAPVQEQATPIFDPGSLPAAPEVLPPPSAYAITLAPGRFDPNALPSAPPILPPPSAPPGPFQEDEFRHAGMMIQHPIQRDLSSHPTAAELGGPSDSHPSQPRSVQPAPARAKRMDWLWIVGVVVAALLAGLTGYFIVSKLRG